jgi:exonuclease III
VQLRLKILTYKVTITGISAPVEGKTTETEEFYDELRAAVDENNKQDYLILAGDINARVGAQPVNKHIVSEGEQTVNNNGRDLIDLCLFNTLKITNTFFRHKNIHKFTWETRGIKSIIDYIIINENLKNEIRDTRVFRGSEIDTASKYI